MTLRLTGGTALLAALAAGPASAGAIVDGNYPSRCNTSNVTLEQVSLSAAPGTVVTGPNAGIASTVCIGPVGEYNDERYSNPDPNLGQLGDGLLNGQLSKSGEMLFDPETLAPSVEWTDENTPGWIHLAHIDGGLGTSYSAIGEEGLVLGPLQEDFSLEDGILGLLDITFECDTTGSECTSGTWTIATDPAIVAIAQGTFGFGVFDHLALVLKAGSGASGSGKTSKAGGSPKAGKGPAADDEARTGGWVLYDIDFGDLFAEGALGQDFDFLTAYTLSGTWNTADLGGKALSHANIWARDPAAPNEIPNPGTLMLFGAGIAAIGWRRRGQVLHARPTLRQDVLTGSADR